MKNLSEFSKIFSRIKLLFHSYHTLFPFLLILTCLFNMVFGYSVSQAQETATPSGILLSQVEPAIDQFMKDKINKFSPGTMVAIYKDGQIVFSKGYGVANIEKNEPVTSNTVFEYGSISKLFVWTSVMQLVEQGKIDLDKDIKSYLPASFTAKWKPTYSITMRQIMNHSSGYGEYPFDIILTKKPSIEISLEKSILSAHPTQFYKPGTATSYSNYATAIAGLVVENVSRMPFYQYEREHIFNVIGMSNIAAARSWQDNPSILSQKAQGYMKKDSTFTPFGWSYVPMYPAGSINGTADQLLLFASDLMNNQSKLLKGASIETLFEPSYEKGADGTCHGFFGYDSKTGKAFGHGGNTGGFSAQFAFVPKQQFAFVVLTNVAGEIEITMGLHDLLLGNTMNQTKASTVNMSDVKNITGRYVSMRRAVGTPLEFMSYLTSAELKELGPNQIQFSMYGFKGDYVQISPNQYKLAKADKPLLNVAVSNFTVSHGDHGEHILLFGNGMDFSRLNGLRSTPALIGNLFTLMFSLIFSIISVIRQLIRRKKDISPNHLFVPTMSLNGLGLGIILEVFILVVFTMTNPLASSSQIRLFQILIIVFSVLSVLTIIRGLTQWKNEQVSSHQVWFVISIIVVISLINLLFFWNFFHIIGF